MEYFNKYKDKGLICEGEIDMDVEELYGLEIAREMEMVEKEVTLKYYMVVDDGRNVLAG